MSQIAFLKSVNLTNWKRLLARKKQDLGGNKRGKASPLFCLLWTAADHFKQGILGWVLGDHSAKTFEPLWAIVATWHCYFYITDGWSVYPGFIPDGDQIISKTANRAGGYLQLASGGCAYMTRVEGENTRLRHYLARLHRSFFVLFQIKRNAQTFNSIVTALS
jgi:IS1 family transposase